MFHLNHDKNNSEDHLNSLESGLHCVEIYNITSTCKYDAVNYLIIDSSHEHVLTKRENIFINLLIKKRGIITYVEMENFINGNYSKVNPNAIRIFVKNFRKKLPENILKNFTGVGYKLVL